MLFPKFKAVKQIKVLVPILIFFIIILYSSLFAVEVEFTYQAPDANKVTIAGEFNNWDKNANPMQKKNGIWYIKLDLPPGKYEYKFVIDGTRWVEDPKAEKFVKDPYGGRNSVIIVKPKLKKGEKPPYKYVNLTGTFNNWNQADKNYIMKYIGDKTYEIVKLFYPGSYQFKFNMNKSWSINYGAGDKGPFSLKQNGDNIKFFADDLRFYKFTLYLSLKKYKIEKVTPKKPVAYVEYEPFYYVGDKIILDASKSLVREGKTAKFYWKQNKRNPVKISKSKRKKNKLIITAKKPGIYKYILEINDGIKGIPYKIKFEVVNRYSLVGDLTSNNSKAPETFLEYKGNKIYEKIISTDKSGVFNFKLIKNFKYNILDAFSFKLKKGKYYLFTYNERINDFSFEKKNFARFYFNPAKDSRVKGEVKTVAVAGSFNNWNTESHYLKKQPDGSFLLYLPLEEGLYYYKFVINGTQWLYDLNSPSELKANDGFGGFNSGIFVGDRAEDFGKPVKKSINWEAVEHSPDEMKYFNVLGKKLLEIKLRTIKNDADKVKIVYFAPRKHIAELSSKIKKFGFDYFSNILTIPADIKELKYYFILIDKGKKFYYADNYTGKNPPSRRYYFKARLKLKFPTPDWAKGVVWYQIMVDRFRNGDKSNDPDCTIPWRWDWFKKYKCEKWDDKRFMDKRYGFYGWDGVWGRLYGGDLQGLMEKLDYLKDLGVGAIYLNPVFESPSHHKYDTADYRHIDDNFGFKGDNKNLKETLNPKTWKWTKTDKLFLKFLKKAHSMGLKVIIDGVFNHCGDRFWAFLDVKKRKKKSPYKDWFVITSWNPFQYEGWGGFGGLPVYKEDENGLVKGIRDHIFDITKRWMDPNGDGDPSDGIDGWRLDVPNEVNPNFWKKWRKLVKSINPDAYITGEIWENASFWLKGEHFDAVMNYEFAKIVYKFFINTKKEYKINAKEFDKALKDLLSSYPMQVNFVMQNLFDSHDTDRILSGIKNPNRHFDAKNRIQDSGPNYDNSKPTAREIKIYKLIQLFQFTFVGSPMIYYGDEVGMWGADDPNNRKPLNHTKKIAKIRNQHSALKTGIFNTLVINNEKNIYGFTRSDENETLYIILNNSNKRQKITIKVDSKNKKLKDLLTGKTYKIKDKKLKLTLKPKYGVILK